MQNGGLYPKDHAESQMSIKLCASEDLRDPGAKGVSALIAGQTHEFVLVRHGSVLEAYVNVCPHQGTPLETFPDKFLSGDGKLLICSTHGARFRIEDGHCVSGPCKGEALTRVAIEEKDGSIFLK